MRRRLLPSAVTALALSLAVAGCSLSDDTQQADGQAGSGDSSQGPVVAVATTTQLGSVLDRVAACGGGSAVTVMGPGDDPHDYSASSQQVAQMVDAGIVFANGLGLEGGMGAALGGAARDGADVVEVAPQLDPMPFGQSTHAGEHGHDHGSEDPHVWMDVARMARAAEVMGDSLAEHRNEPGYAECGRTVRGELEETDAEVRRILSEVPEDRRTIATDHDAYGYFAAAYGLEVSGTVIPGGSTDAEPSSQELAALTSSLRQDGTDVLVTSVGLPSGLVDTVAAEAGGMPVVHLYESGVGPAGTAEADYADAMLFNARTLADALKG
ncbi:metal ABC transporter substrate-binding protein [Micrococcus sp.]|uniref:metal ABC transporter substrate-binding protein n=1 Tax=Micrococcus sp. TaxID=1271 RepID=UPI002A917947|nr:metal ABC transporter substrate-binding protein [Micrococcus sp.]MDY6055643.1 metal ABC transporter substrate-binding protein [Micrococcus sp.]